MQDFDEAERAAVYRVIAERRDVRRGFLAKPVPDDVLMRVLGAAHSAPSVGLMQPTRFLVVRDPALRQQVHDVFLAANQAATAVYDPARAEQYRALKLEGILDSALNVCVLCDAASEQGHGLGRHSSPETAIYSTVCAVQNLWLAARAEGIGVGWVSILHMARLREILSVPPSLTIVAYLCAGYVDRFNDVPELEQLGWEQRRPLATCVATDRCEGAWSTCRETERGAQSS